jgi:hypothetical protein
MFQLRGEPIAIAVFPNPRQQTDALGRISYYNEGNIGSIVSQRQLQNLYDTGQHRPPGACDFHAQGVANFYNAFMEAQGMRPNLELTSGETWLRDQLLMSGILRRDHNGRYSVGNTDYAVISYQALSGGLNTIIKHELNHAFFYTDAGFRRQMEAVWNSLPRSAQAQIRDWLQSKHYDVRSHTVVLKEFGAYFADYAGSSRITGSIRQIENNPHWQTIQLAAQRLHQQFANRSGITERVDRPQYDGFDPF